jgi:hypothetical protein
MARGWESKAVEAQIEDRARGRSTGPVLSGVERERAARRASLELIRTRVERELEDARPPRRQALEQALRELEAELRKLAVE